MDENVLVNSDLNTKNAQQQLDCISTDDLPFLDDPLVSAAGQPKWTLLGSDVNHLTVVWWAYKRAREAMES
jgi:hypothetical protein